MNNYKRTESNALINNDVRALEQRRKLKRQKVEEKNEIETLKETVRKLEDRISELEKIVNVN